MTLVEVLISVSLSTLITVGLIGTFILLNRDLLAQFAMNRVVHEARLVADHFARDLRAASDVVDTYDTYTTSDTTVIMRVPAVDASEAMIDGVFDHIIYDVRVVGSSQVLYRVVDAAPSSTRVDEEVVIGGGLTGSRIRGTFASHPDALGAFVIHYQFTASFAYRDEVHEIPISGSVRLRNNLS